MPKLASDKLCTGCLACMDTCPKQAIKIRTQNGMPFPVVDETICINCRLCEKACPINQPPTKNSVEGEIAFAGWAKEESFRKNAASGGAFAAIASNFFDKYENGIVVGANLKNNQVFHICIDSKNDIPLLMNSKYIQSHTEGIFKLVEHHLKNERNVLFSGLPCQVAGILNYFSNKPSLRKNLWTIDLVCHGVASQEALDLHLKFYKADSILQFRDKASYEKYGTSQNTVLSINNHNEIIDRKKDVFYNIFASWLLDRPSCTDCKFARLERTADITIGDFWGKPHAHSKGVSLILANNEKGLQIVYESNHLHLSPSTLKEAFYSNPNLWTGWKATKWHPIVLWPDWFRNHISERTRLNILTRKNKPWKIIWAFYKIITIIHIKIKRKQIAKQYKNLLK